MPGVIRGTIVKATFRNPMTALVVVEWDEPGVNPRWCAMLDDFRVLAHSDIVGRKVEAFPEDQFVKPMTSTQCPHCGEEFDSTYTGNLCPGCGRTW